MNINQKEINIKKLINSYTIETTPNVYKKIDSLSQYLPHGNNVYITYLPDEDPKRIINTAKKIILEGGGTVNWSFIKQNLIDEAIITVAPYILGGKNSISLVEGSGFKNLTSCVKLKLKKLQKNKNELILYYKYKL